MKEFDPTRYRITVVNKDVDGHHFFVGTVVEFPHVKVYEDSWADAYQAILGMISDFYDQACETGEPFPEPSHEEPSYSGRVTVRIPKWLHQRLDEQAIEQEVSLNFHISTLLTEGSNWLQNRASSKTVHEVKVHHLADFSRSHVITLDVSGVQDLEANILEQNKPAQPSSTREVLYNYEQIFH